VPVCRQCGKEWPEGYAVCPDDGMRISLSPTTVRNNPNGPLAIAEPVLDEELAPGSACGEYVIERKIGEGGMGAVYGARHPVIGKRAAIKVIKRELSASRDGVDRFVREAQAVNTIGHPNIVDVFGFGTLPDGRSFFVMEWLEGESLRDRMTRPLAFAQALEVLESIAIALRAAHEAGVVHRDLKPDNVFLARAKGSTAPRVKLLDFGLAKLSGASHEVRVDHTRTGVVMGTPLYLSPEQAKGVKIDFATDVYSLGVIAYEMAAGGVPFTAESAVEIMAAHISAMPAPLRERAPWIPPAYEQIVMRMLAKEPRARPSIIEIETAFTDMRTQPAIANAAPVAGGLVAQWTPVAAATPRPAAPSGVGAASAIEPPRRHRGVVIGAIAVVVIAGGVIAWAALGNTSEPKPKHVDVAPPAPAPSPEPAKPIAPPPAPAPIAAVAPPPAPEPAKPDPVKHVAAKPGTLVIAIAGAQHGNVLVDGKLVASDVATISVEVAAGEHRVRVEASGHRPVQQSVRVEPGAKKPLSVQLGAKTFNTVHDPFAE